MISRHTFRASAAACLLAVSTLLVPGARATDEVSAGGPDPDIFIDGLIRSLTEQPESPVPITLEDAISSAVQHNPGLRASQRESESADYDVLEASGFYDPVVWVEGNWIDSNRLTSNLTETGIPDDPAAVILEEIAEDEAILDTGVSKNFKYGTQLDLAWTNRRRTTDAAFQALSPNYDPAVALTLSQPLLDDFGGLAGRTAIGLARNTSRQAAAGYEARLSDFVAEIVDAYWNVTQAEADVRVRRHALKLAGELVDETKSRVKIGTLPPVAAREAEADQASREEELIRAENDLDLNARTLQYMVLYGAASTPLPIRPSQQHVVVDVALARNESLETAVQRRPEVRSARVALRSAMLSERQARNLLLPSLDLVGSYTLLGLGGEPFDESESDSYSEALDRMVSSDYYRYSVGLRFEMPLSNATARAGHAKALIEVRRNEDTLRQVVTDVALEIERTIGDVASARKRVDAARIARELAEENLANQKRRYDVGMVTTTDVLLFQDDVTSAMAAEAQAVADHARSLARLRRAEGTLLDRYGIRVSYEDAPTIPWWAKF